MSKNPLNLGAFKQETSFDHLNTPVQLGISAINSDALFMLVLYTGSETMFRPAHSGKTIEVSTVPI